MPHVRILRHYVHTPFLFLAGAEIALVALNAYLGHLLWRGEWPRTENFLSLALGFGAVIVAAMSAMGVYESRVREGFTGMTLRTAVAIFLLGTILFTVLFYALPGMVPHRGVLVISIFLSFFSLLLFRWIVFQFLSEDALKSRIVVLGTGGRALKIATRMRRQADQRAFILVGFINLRDEDNQVRQHGARIIGKPDSMLAYCRDNAVDEIVVAVEGLDEDKSVPVDQLVDCRLSGIKVCDVQEFFEREACKLDVDILRPTWLAFSDGFVTNRWRSINKRIFDLITASVMLIFTLPVMILTALCIYLEMRGRHSVLYRQERVGRNGVNFRVYKFRSMRASVSDNESEFAAHNDPRITRVGRFIRKTRIDELPQLFNVLLGEMSFVGPRPEQPVHVERFAREIPYYDQRHRIKPGITGWAQLCFPYGTTVADAKEKLQYDLYYLKNQSLFLDLVIMMQTIEVVLVGEGSR
ncbi:MAG: TIGR03013 family PEP-CTERM/XrtA system glycosyltransferase [Pseudomonadales bacterium]|nr:TIGR03013 family PEP-CTERM/XrtA system glycosyltransferase [Pseudomonadales bacterium]MCP5185793.1 TIGR03013 family PEP-CTERM/XrtA system glycosyltransferase [Pseudomonadales bacterium]